jgi:hypothetical protein
VTGPVFQRDLRDAHLTVERWRLLTTAAAGSVAALIAGSEPRARPVTASARSPWATRGGSRACHQGLAGHARVPTGNAATITFPAAGVRFVRLTVTANSGWPVGQISEFEV